jgi:hypothetical protein
MKKILEEIEQEGFRQDAKGFNDAHDDGHSLEALCDHVIAYAQLAKQMLRMDSPERFRRKMMQTGTIAAKTCESFDRRFNKS